MDPATLVGIGLAFFALFGSMVMEGGNPMSIILIPPMMLVILGTFGVAMASGMMRDTTAVAAQLKRALLSKKQSADASIATVVELAERARREGLLVLEEMAKTIDDDFLRKGIELAVDGTDPEELREILEAEVQAKRSADKAGAKFFADMGGFAPTLGILGTVLGLVHVLQNLSEPAKLGDLIAGAFVATLWGVMTANVLWLPIANKLKRLSELETHRMELILEGILSIQAGANPRIIEQKLLSFLHPADRPPEERAA